MRIAQPSLWDWGCSDGRYPAFKRWTIFPPQADAYGTDAASWRPRGIRIGKMWVTQSLLEIAAP